MSTKIIDGEERPVRHIKAYTIHLEGFMVPFLIIFLLIAVDAYTGRRLTDLFMPKASSCTEAKIEKQ